MRITPWITTLQQNEIICVGTNRQGFHGIGAAKTAYDKFGLAWGFSEGLCGQAYAIPTKKTPWQSLTVKEIGSHVGAFIYYAEEHPELKFYVTEVGCGYAGYKPKDIAPYFRGTMNLENIWLPESFWKVLQ